MKTDSIKMILNSKFGPQESYSEDQLQQISSLTINRFDVVGDFLSIEPEELLKFPNLRRLALDQCVLGSDFIAILVQLKNLETLSLYHCEFMGHAEALFQMPYLKKILLDSTEIPMSYLKDGMFTSITLSNIEINENVFFYTDILDISKADVSNWNIIHSKIGKLIVSESQFQKNRELQNYSSSIEVRDDIDSNTILEEVNV